MTLAHKKRGGRGGGTYGSIGRHPKGKRYQK